MQPTAGADDVDSLQVSSRVQYSGGFGVFPRLRWLSRYRDVGRTRCASLRWSADGDQSCSFCGCKVERRTPPSETYCWRRRTGYGIRDTVQKFQTQLSEIAIDLKIVRERIKNDDVTAALAKAEDRILDWSETELKLLRTPPDDLTMDPASLSVAQNST